MYGFQQHLTQVQKELLKAQQSTVELSSIRHSTEEHVSCLHKQVDEETSLAHKERDKVRIALLHHQLFRIGRQGNQCNSYLIKTMLTSEPLQMEAFRDELNTISNIVNRLKALSQEQRSEIGVAQRYQ